MTRPPDLSATSLIWKNLEKDPAVVYALDTELRVVRCNQAWDRFAAENGGIGLERENQRGRAIIEVIPAPLKQLFQEGYGKVLYSAEPWEHTYECSSPATYRSFRMVVYPNPEAPGLVVVNSLNVERPHGAEIEPRDPSGLVYSDQQGMITMCCQCRRTCRANCPDIWDWVPGFVERPPDRVTHGLCTACVNLIYPEFASDEM